MPLARTVFRTRFFNMFEEAEGSKSLAVLGLYSSGSTALAGVLDGLGINMGSPYYWDDGECFYEPEELGRKLRKWWSQPKGEAVMSVSLRHSYLRRWRKQQVPESHGYVGVKHPLFCLGAPDLESAWGSSVRWIRSARSLDRSIDSLKRRQWRPFLNEEETLQRKLWRGLEEFLASRDHLRVEFDELLEDPSRQVERLTEFLEITPSEEQIQTAISRVRRPK